MTPFEAEGYTKDTKFRVLHDDGDLKKGDIVILSSDTGDCSPFFTLAGCYERRGYQRSMYLPGEAGYAEDEDLEVYIEEPEQIKEDKHMTPFEKAGYTKDTKFKVLVDYESLRSGDTVQLYMDCGNYAPLFMNDRGGKAAMFMPATEGEREELEVYIEEEEGISVEDITQAEINAGNIAPEWHEWLGKEGSQRYNLIRTICKVVDGDECKEAGVLGDCYQDLINTHTMSHNSVLRAANTIKQAIDFNRTFLLKSEDKEVLAQKREAKLAEIKELEDNLAKLKAEVEGEL